VESSAAAQLTWSATVSSFVIFFDDILKTAAEKVEEAHFFEHFIKHVIEMTPTATVRRAVCWLARGS
jgi:hypothetical protein